MDTLRKVILFSLIGVVLITILVVVLIPSDSQNGNDAPKVKGNSKEKAHKPKAVAAGNNK